MRAPILVSSLLALSVTACGDGTPGLVDRLAAAKDAAGAAGSALEMANQMRESTEEAAAHQRAGVSIDPVDFRELKALLPQELPGMQRAHTGGEKNGAMGVAVSKATAEYQALDASDAGVIHITITDLGAMKPMAAVGLAAWAMMEVDKETDTGFERTIRYRSHPGYESYRGTSEAGDGEMQALIEKRFIVEVRGRNLPMSRIRDAMERLNLSALQAMKDAGVAKAG